MKFENPLATIEGFKLKRKLKKKSYIWFNLIKSEKTLKFNNDFKINC
jgi:hypothetical protein